MKLKKNQKEKLLNDLYELYKNCKECPLGNLGRTNIVFGEGNPNAKLLFIGEAPGQQEDILNRPFIGKSGKLFTKSLEAAGSSREKVYITNIVKCRPPHNRKPMPQEAAICINLLLLKQISIIQPSVICLLGTTALNTLLTKKTISIMRGIPIKKEGIIFVPSFHPAYILRNSTQLEKFFNDIQLAVSLSNQKQKRI